MKAKFNRRQKWIAACSVMLMLVVWQLLSLYYKSDFILPGPWQTIVKVGKLICSLDFLAVAGTTILRGLMGFAIAAVLGIGLGIWAGLSDNFRAFLMPWLVVFRSTPVIAIALLALIWFSPDSVPVFIGLLTMFPLVCMNVMDGMKSVDPSLVEMAEFYKVGRRRIIREVYVPAIAPFIYSGISSAIGIGWRAIIVGEVLSQPKYGIGTRMQTAQTFLNVDALIAWTMIAILLSYGFEALVRVFERWTVRWKEV
jgi:NitT/TauT family transport system permease protein